ncbi:GNAT family N-acetyltransferase [[Clostridium] fimetarium]|uniref:Acetyltransferase (GNAT) family protein n=1 Tax=[Clostridium] fimetarium TaxID=99656 RepID=A0A1I0M7R0_9FIRM|nr:N-acetyltransferase [[Clostridium] fimetarium]SEV83984.1 Acetyltransferase (GNAT) family protein [[Clostridium] fimetarium]
MENISIVNGNPMSQVGGKLNSIALDYMAYPLIGSKNSNLIEKTFNKLWTLTSNRFSHQYAFEAQINQKTVGMITCYPVSEMKKLAWPTFKKLISIRNWALISHSLMNFRELWSIASLNEGREDEYHIGTLATLPESRGYGIGSKLIAFAEEQAKLSKYNKCSLTVKKENIQAFKLYERMGYQIVDSIEKYPYNMYRMVKHI